MIFELNQKCEKNHDFQKTLNIFENTHESRLFSRISTLVENLNYFRKSELISKKSTFGEKVNFSQKILLFSKNSYFFEKVCCGPQFIIMKARRTAIAVSNAIYRKS